MTRAVNLSIAFVSAVVAFAPAARAGTSSGAELADALRHGGYILLMRHASSPRTPPETGKANPDNKNTERQLDDEGRATAKRMGDQMRRAKIPVGDVLSSPTYRALETVRYATFGEPKTFAELGDGGRSMEAVNSETRSAWLKGQLTKQPRAGTNSVIVTHMPNIVEALGQEWSSVADSETLVIQPGGAKGFNVVARLKADEWRSFDVTASSKSVADERLDAIMAELAALKAENERLRTLIPGQSHAMVDVAYQFTNLWFAGQAENWPLAQFYFNETRSRIKWTIRLSPTRKTKAGGEIKLQEIFDPVDTSLFAEIQKQIPAKDRKQFGAAYKAALAGCNGCHVASEKPYLHVVIPTQPENRIVEFKQHADPK